MYLIEFTEACLCICGVVEAKDLKVGELSEVFVQEEVLNMKKRKVKVVVDLID